MKRYYMEVEFLKSIIANNSPIKTKKLQDDFISELFVFEKDGIEYVLEYESCPRGYTCFWLLNNEDTYFVYKKIDYKEKI